MKKFTFFENSKNKLKVFLIYLKKIVEFFKYVIKLLFLFFLLIYPCGQFILDSIDNHKLFNLNVITFTPLAITLSFSSLMFNRARSIDSKHHKFRSLYIAERLLSASSYYLLTLLAIFLCYQISIVYNFDINLKGNIVTNYKSSIIFLPIWFFLGFCADVFFLTTSLQMDIAGRLPKHFAYKVKKLLSSH